MCDNAKYLLGISQEQMKKAKREQKSALMLQGKDIYLYWLREKVRWPRQYTYFLKSGILKKQWNIRKSEIIGKKLQMEAILIFGMDMDYAQDDTEVKVAWDSHNSGESKDVQGICLVTGERAEIARITEESKVSGCAVKWSGTGFL